MGVWVEPHVSFNTGYLGPYMRGRTDLKEYISGALQVNNVIMLPHGGVMRRRGLGFLYEFTGLSSVDFNKAIMVNYKYNRDQEYLLAFMPNNLIYIFRNRQLKATIAHPYSAADLRRIKWCQQLDRMMIFHPSYPVKKLFRNGTTDSQWGIGDIAWINYPFYRFNQSQKMTASGTLTVGGTCTLALDGTFPYFSAVYSQGVLIKPQVTTGTDGIVRTNSFPQDATGGTALASAGTAANAFDAAATTCNCGVNGWIGYSWGSTSQKVEIVGIQINTTATVDLVFETDSVDAFTSAVQVGTLTGVTLTTGVMQWFDVPSNAGNTRFRIRVTNGATFDLQNVVFAFGLKVTGIVTVAVAATSNSNSWQEQMWGPHKGYPGCGTFFSDRLCVAGIRDLPNSIAARNVSDYFNFDDTKTTDAYTFKFLVSSGENNSVYNIVQSRKGMVAMCSDGEFSLEGTDALVTPTKPMKAYQQTAVGSVNLPIITVDGQVLFITQDRKQVQTLNYDFGTDSYLTASLTLYAHDMFVDLLQKLQLPRRLALLMNYRDTQSNILLVPTTSGIVATLTYDSRSNVRAWATWDTPNGLFLDSCVVHSLQDSRVGVVSEAYFLVNRTINGVQRLYLEVFENQQDVYLDHWCEGNGTGTSWVFPDAIAFTDISVTVNDSSGLAVIGDFTTDGTGHFTTPDAVTNPFAGLRYFRTLETMPVAPELASASLKGRRPIALKEVGITFDGSLAATVNEKYPVGFRYYDNEMFDTNPTPKTGPTHVTVNNMPGQQYDPTILIETDQPVPMTITNLTITYKAGQA